MTIQRVAQFRYVAFQIETTRFGVSLDSIERVLRAIEVTPSDDAPAGVLGVINVAGEMLSVYDMRTRFGHPERDIDVNDHLAIARTPSRRLAFFCDRVLGVVDGSELDAVETIEFAIGNADLGRPVVKLADGLQYIHDLEKFLSDEPRATRAATGRGEEGG